MVFKQKVYDDNADGPIEYSITSANSSDSAELKTLEMPQNTYSISVILTDTKILSFQVLFNGQN